MKNEMGTAVVAGDNCKSLDAHCKRILANKQIAALILQECAEEYKELELEQIEALIENDPKISEVPVDPDLTGKYLKEQKINGMPNEDKLLYEGTVSFDILFKVALPNGEGQTELIVNIEAQNDFNPGYRLVTRGPYYCARMLSAQKNQEFFGSKYDDLKKVHSVWICIHPTKEWEGAINTYKMCEEIISGNAKEEKAAYDKLQITILCLEKQDTINEKKLMRILGTLFVENMPACQKLEILEQEGIDCDTLESEVNEMCNYSQYIEDRGIEKGMQQGMQKGELKGQFKAILALRETLFNGDLEKIMDMVKIPQKDRAYFREEIQKLEKEDK